MAAVNWFCLSLVLAFAFINGYVCIKVDTNISNENYTTTIRLNSQTTILPYKANDGNEPENNTLLLGDKELSQSERTRRLIPYMTFYVPVSELPINKQYATNSQNHNNIHMTKQQQQTVSRPSSATIGNSGSPSASTHIPIPPQYVNTAGLQYSPAAGPTHTSAGEQYYPPNTGLGFYPANGGDSYRGGQYHLLVPATSGHSEYLQPPGLPGPSALGLPAGPVTNKANGNNAFATFKEFKGGPIRHKTVQHFPPLSSTAQSASSGSAALSSVIKQPQQYKAYGNGGAIPATAAGVYRPRTKQQSKINLTPFTPANSVPGNFVPIVYAPVSTNIKNNNNNNNLHLPTSAVKETSPIDDDTSHIFNHNENLRLQQEQLQQQQQLYRKQQQPPQVAIEYSSGQLPPTAPSSQQTQHQHSLPSPAKQQQKSQYFTVTTSPLSPVNVDLTHNVGTVNGRIIGGVVQHHHQQQQHHSTPAISPASPIINIYHQNPQNHHHQEAEHVIIDATLRTEQQQQQQQQQQQHIVTFIGTQQQPQQQQPFQDKSIGHFQPPKSENFFESEIPIQQQQQQPNKYHYHHNIDQVLKDVNSYSIKSSHMMTPQEKYVLYLQQRARYNKQQPQQHVGTQQKYREREYQQQQQQQQYQNPTQIFVLSSTMSPPLLLHQKYDTNYPQHSPTHHDLYTKQSNPTNGRDGGVGHDAATDAHNERQEHILTIPVHSLFGNLEEFQKQTHYSPTHSVSPSLSHNAQYPKAGPSTPQYIDYVIDEPKQSLDDEQHYNVIQSQRNNNQHHQRHQTQNTQLKLLKPTLGPPTHAFILVTAAPPYHPEPEPQENYSSSLRPPKIRLQSVIKENNADYPAINQQNPAERQQVVAITPTPKTTTTSINQQEEDLSAKYVYIKEEFGQKIPIRQEGTKLKLKPSKSYESDDNQIPKQRSQTPTTLPPKTILNDPNELPDIRTSSLAEILHKLQESNHLPHTLTPDNIDNSIKTLIRILNNLKQTQTIVANPPQHHETPAHHTHPSSPDYDYNTGSGEEEQQKQHQPQAQDIHILAPTGPNKHPGPSTGRPGIDYPNYAEIPETSFHCSQQRYKGFFGDPETNCQVWHYCDLNGGKASFLCPNGTIFSQIALTCDWWFNVKCAATPQLYVLNERLYKYILPFTPKFPEDYSGPIVDKYLAMKFQEMEEKMRLEKEKALLEESEATAAATEQNQQEDATVTENSKEDNHLEETTTTEDEQQRQIKSQTSILPAINHKHESVNSQVSEQSSERNLLIDDEVNDISQRGKADDFESTTIATMTATIKSNAAVISYSLKPIIVSSTLEPDYDEEQLQHHDNKRSHISDIISEKKTESEIIHPEDETNDDFKISSSSTEIPQVNKMQITVEKVNVIEIKPDGHTGHLIRDMLLNTKQN